MPSAYESQPCKSGLFLRKTSGDDLRRIERTVVQTNDAVLSAGTSKINEDIGPPVLSVLSCHVMELLAEDSAEWNGP